MDSVFKISIVTPSYNQAEYLPATIESVASQQVDVPVEHLVMDGGSTDGSQEILKQNRHRLTFVSEPDDGMPDALNKGFTMAGGNILGWLNSDDLYLPGALQSVATYFRDHPDCLWLYGNCRMIDHHGRETRKWITAYKTRRSRPFIYERLLTENFISQPAVFFRREALERAGPVDITLPTAMDYDLWLRFARLGPPGYIPDYLAAFRVHPGSISAKNYRAQFEEQYGIHQRYDSTPDLLLKHRRMIFRIVTVYRIMGILRRLFWA